MEKRSKNAETQNVRTVSYWTQRRKIRAAVNEFFNSVENPHGADVSGPQETEQISECLLSVHADEMTYENNNGDDGQIHSPMFVSTSSDDSECEINDFVPCEPDTGSDEEECLANSLVDWVSKFNIPQNAATALLHILQPLHPSLPSDARTLMRTPRNFSIKQIPGGGEYVHFGIQNGIEKLHNGGHIGNMDTLELQFGIDGVALFKSSNTSLWPILCSVKNITSKPFVVGVFCGNSKPGNIVGFLSDFVQELNALLMDDLEFAETRFKITVHSFVCDTPARAMLKNVKGPTGYFGCDKCETEGEWHGKITFLDTNAQSRTDVRFDELSNEEHHLGPSALQSLPIGMVSQFPLDYMHLVCLGVMRRLLLCWLKGPLPTRLCARKVQQLSEKLMSIAAFVPREFVRKPRSVSEILRWKATELRQFLLYTGPVVLLRILPESLYKHFLLMSVGISLLANPKLCSAYYDYANGLLRTFVNNAAALYGHDMMVYNVHALIHLADDVKRFGCLDNFSAFPFENCLMSIKKMIRKPNCILQQVASRLSEQVKCQSPTSKFDGCFGKKEHDTGPVPRGFLHARQYNALQTKVFYLSSSSGDNCVANEEGRPCLIRNILLLESNFVLVVEYFGVVKDFFDCPLPSSTVAVFHVSDLSGEYQTLQVDSVSHKFVAMPSEQDSFVLVPLVHIQ